MKKYTTQALDLMSQLVHFECFRNLTNKFSAKLTLQKNSSQELKYILPSCKKEWKASLILP